MSAVRGFQTSAVSRDIDSAAKFIGAGAATVGIAGSGMLMLHMCFPSLPAYLKCVLLYCLLK